jgi:hypothetical protein
MYRLVLERVATMTEMHTVLSVADVFDLNDALTAKQVAEQPRSR